MSNNNLILTLIQALLKAFCGGSSQDQDNYQNQQQQQQQYPQQQQQGYSPQQPWQQQQQTQHQNGQSWSQVAAGQNGQYQSHHQNGAAYGEPHKPSAPAGGVLGPHHPGYQNQDMINSTNDRYQQLRNKARREGDEAHKCFAQSQEAYQSGDGGRAHDLSVQGKAHQQKQDQLDDEAAEWIFQENNKHSPPGTIDLHGLYVKEAIERTEGAIALAQRSGQDELKVVVGKGIHSQGHVAKIKPAVEGLMRKYNLSAHVDPHNSGVLIVDLEGRETNGRTRDAGGLVDEMERKEDGDCVIM